ncbi:uncharacterized protein N7477_000992 [Penicillium maclennaniae]|uniref:uncharacterized protein n=1 Tax=Penicillium maclennaniae TaxID=1343394 RepID=UPI002540989F|nr:uncharacterized protein N7477_000992 [Penicillium maclennaniae]KAJ5684647.1 hypothetical protein N7477_000992 [Penicillium maclennaniae]
MFREKSPDLEDGDFESRESLLPEEQEAWSQDDEFDSCDDCVTTVLQLTALGVFFLLGLLFGTMWHGDLDSRCSQHVARYSPVMSEVGITYHLQRSNNPLLKDSVYRQEANPEVDAAWDALGVNYRSIRVSPEEAAESDFSSDQVKINPSYGGGFPADVEGLRHLQCLNLLRQSLYFNYDYYHSEGKGVFANNDFIARHQIAQCVDVLRQQLMCTVDTGVVGQVWIYPENPEPFVNFNTRQRCKNFDEIREWAEKRQLPEDLPLDFLQPPAPGEHIYKAMP